MSIKVPSRFRNAGGVIAYCDRHVVIYHVHWDNACRRFMAPADHDFAPCPDSISTSTIGHRTWTSFRSPTFTAKKGIPYAIEAGECVCLIINALGELGTSYATNTFSYVGLNHNVLRPSRSERVLVKPFIGSAHRPRALAGSTSEDGAMRHDLRQSAEYRELTGAMSSALYILRHVESRSRIAHRHTLNRCHLVLSRRML